MNLKKMKNIGMIITGLIFFGNIGLIAQDDFKKVNNKPIEIEQNKNYVVIDDNLYAISVLENGIAIPEQVNISERLDKNKDYFVARDGYIYEVLAQTGSTASRGARSKNQRGVRFVSSNAFIQKFVPAVNSAATAIQSTPSSSTSSTTSTSNNSTNSNNAPVTREEFLNAIDSLKNEISNLKNKKKNGAFVNYVHF